MFNVGCKCIQSGFKNEYISFEFFVKKKFFPKKGQNSEVEQNLSNKVENVFQTQVLSIDLQNLVY